MGSSPVYHLPGALVPNVLDAWHFWTSSSTYGHMPLEDRGQCPQTPLVQQRHAAPCSLTTPISAFTMPPSHQASLRLLCGLCIHLLPYLGSKEGHESYDFESI